jgi:hypothetical protein
MSVTRRNKRSADGISESARYHADRAKDMIERAVRDAILEERQRCARIVEGWHYKKGGYRELSRRLMEYDL